MVTPSLSSLVDLCGIRIAYLMWTRRDVAKKCWKKEEINELEDVVLADVQLLPLPRRVKSRVLNHMRPAGERLLSLLSLWLSKLPSETPQKWLLGNMLFDCLILNADGLINQRKTAQTLLGNRMLHNIFAFRLAAINFLENEVFKLWIFVKEYFLNKIILENGQCHLFIEKDSHINFLSSIFPDSILDSNARGNAISSSFPSTTEPAEVLFWISYCLLKENEIDIKEVPHFMGNDVDWFESLLQYAASSGNVSCFEYFKNICKRKSEYDHVDMIKRILTTGEKECEQPSFIFHFMLLNSKEKTELFQEFPIKMVSHFLQWPLSLTFLENTEGVWNLIPNKHKEWAFLALSEILINENMLLNPFSDEDRDFTDNPINTKTVAFCVEHLSEIWIALWKNRSYSAKTDFLNSFVFLDFEVSDSEEEWAEFPKKFRSSGLKQKLLRLFLSRGEAILELFEGENVKESLRSLVAKYMPEDFKDLDRECISFLSTRLIQYGNLQKLPVRKMARRVKKYPGTPINEAYLTYIKKNLFSMYRS